MHHRIVVLQGNASSEHLVTCVTNSEMDILSRGAEYEEWGGSLRQFSYPWCFSDAYSSFTDALSQRSANVPGMPVNPGSC